ncbi:MAG TPA: hypothetical protein EYP56_07150, partial [Planctomycetaceae bacterium]|nr:hypothetical protein [Planctomycetaceae bacterium]
MSRPLGAAGVAAGVLCGLLSGLSPAWAAQRPPSPAAEAEEAPEPPAIAPVLIFYPISFRAPVYAAKYLS